MTSRDPAVELDDAPADAPGPSSRAGRNLPAAVAVGVVLAVLVLAPLLFARALFVPVVVVAIALAVRELVAASRRDGVDPPSVPLLVGGTAMLVLAYVAGADALLLGLLVTVLACAAWRLASPAGPATTSGQDQHPRPPRRLRGLPGRGLEDLGASAFITLYAPFCAGFAVLLLLPDDGGLRVITFIATVVCSDIGGYVAGITAGRHPMAPSISPKKTWEGFAGSAAACVVAGCVFLPVFFGSPIWHGVAFGLAVVASATLGDLGESMVKRDLGVKDMGTLLPGHGGIMDRLDSLLPTAPVAWLLLTASAPPG